jgi:small subunit ribosomal protein S14
MVRKCLIINYSKIKSQISSTEIKNKSLKVDLSKQTNEQSYREAHMLLQQLSKKACSTKHRNRCWKTFRARAYYGFFGLSRMALRELAHKCVLPGLKKASW